MVKLINQKAAVVLLVVLTLSFGVPGFIRHYRISKERDEAARIAASIGSHFAYHFISKGILEEAGELYKSTSPYWWLNSGGLFYVGEGLGQTIQGPLPPDQKWRQKYGKNNPEDTEGGYYPQNIFRLITRGSWYNLEEEVYFKISEYHASASPNRNESNGVLLFGRYRDDDNLYYAGIRVDGLAIIKKKLNGTYYTLAQEKIFNGAYERTRNPNLLPLETWLGLKMKLTTLPDSRVYIELYTDVGKTGNWRLVLIAEDDGSYGEIIDQKASAGLRSDFMDIAFSAYRIDEI